MTIYTLAMFFLIKRAELKLAKEKLTLEKIQDEKRKQEEKFISLQQSTESLYQNWTEQALNNLLCQSGFASEILSIIIPRRSVMELWQRITKDCKEPYEDYQTEDLEELEKSSDVKSIINYHLHHFFLEVLQKFVIKLFEDHKVRLLRRAYCPEIYTDAHLTVYHAAFDAIQRIKPEEVAFKPKFFSYSQVREWLQSELFEHFLAEELTYRIFIYQCWKVYEILSPDKIYKNKRELITVLKPLIDDKFIDFKSVDDEENESENENEEPEDQASDKGNLSSLGPALRRLSIHSPRTPSPSDKSDTSSPRNDRPDSPHLSQP